jgi:hypothetical protein
MDNHAQDFARQIISRLDAIKGLILGALDPDSKKGQRRQKQTSIAETIQDQPESLGNPQFAQPNPSPSPDDHPADPAPKSYPWIRRQRPAIELIGAIVLTVYTAVTIGLWCSSRAANWITKDTAQRQLRAYIGIEPTFINNFKPGDITSVSFKAENFGQTPAYSVMPYTHLAVLPYPLPVNYPFPFDPPSNTQFESIGSAYPHAPITTGVSMGRALTEQEVRAILDGTRVRLYAGGIIRYKDIFGGPHCSRFLATLGGPELIQTINIAKSTGDASVPWRWANRYNDEYLCDNK